MPEKEKACPKNQASPGCWVLCLLGKDITGSSIRRQFPVAYALRFFMAQAFQFVLFILRIGAFEVEYVGIAFEGKDMRADTVQEPAVVGNNHGATGKAF